jgi:chemotaxis protein methyltransferase CheR
VARLGQGEPIVPNAGMNSQLFSIEPHEFEAFRSLIHQQAGIWLRDGKQVMLASRLSRRLRYHNLSSFTEYYDYLNSCNDGGEELTELINCVTTNKTSFFREAHHFEYLANSVVPERLNAFRHIGRIGNGLRQTIRVWSAACATGEEPYTQAVAIACAQRMGYSHRCFRY